MREIDGPWFFGETWETSFFIDTDIAKGLDWDLSDIPDGFAPDDPLICVGCSSLSKGGNSQLFSRVSNNNNAISVDGCMELAFADCFLAGCQ
jgi:hypothetical protein